MGSKVERAKTRESQPVGTQPGGAQVGGAQNGAETPRPAAVGRAWWMLCVAVILLPWVSQPPFGCWPVTFVSIVPLLLAARAESISRKQFVTLYLALAIYWALSLQGLRYANPLIYPCWIALACYLAIYRLVFVVALRRAAGYGIPMVLSAPVAWVSIECVRGYLLTGLSAVMLGHSVADVPAMIQIADLGGTYAVSAVIVVVNVAAVEWWAWIGRRRSESEAPAELAGPAGPAGPERGFPAMSSVVAIAMVAATLLYSMYRLGQPTEPGTTSIALIGRSEPVEYVQDQARQQELFQAFRDQSIRSLESCATTIDAIVWPESMYTGILPYRIGTNHSALAEEYGLSTMEIQAIRMDYSRQFRERSKLLQSRLADHNGPDRRVPEIIAGCGVVDDDPPGRVYSGVVHVGRSGAIKDWYGKTHLVMFGEYIPLIKRIPLLRDWVPKNMGLTTGKHAKLFQVDELKVSPNICIETAVERVPVGHLRQLRRQEAGLPDAMITVTNDGWFDDSSVVVHHRRCAQLVAVACRRPILSAANNGPTVWIDSFGQVVEQLPQGGEGYVLAQPRIDRRTSLVMVIGDWPARICVVLFAAVLIRKPRRGATNEA